MQAGGLAPKVISVTAHINRHRNLGDMGQKSSADGTFNTTK
jgi:hypothetical protein